MGRDGEVDSEGLASVLYIYFDFAANKKRKRGLQGAEVTNLFLWEEIDTLELASGRCGLLMCIAIFRSRRNERPY